MLMSWSCCGAEIPGHGISIAELLTSNSYCGIRMVALPRCILLCKEIWFAPQSANSKVGAGEFCKFRTQPPDLWQIHSSGSCFLCH